MNVTPLTSRDKDETPFGPAPADWFTWAQALTVVQSSHMDPRVLVQLDVTAFVP